MPTAAIALTSLALLLPFSANTATCSAETFTTLTDDSIKPSPTASDNDSAPTTTAADPALFSTYRPASEKPSTKWLQGELTDPFNNQRTRSEELAAPLLGVTSDTTLSTLDVSPRAVPLPPAVWVGLILLTLTIASIQIRKHRLFRN